MLTLSVTNQDSTSPEYGTSTTLDLPDKSLVSYQYSLESDDLSAFTSAYTTSINLPPTHKNLVALNQPQIHGTGGVFTYVLSDDSQEIDHGQFVISSVTDTINVNLFSTVATLNTLLSGITSFVRKSGNIEYVSSSLGVARAASGSTDSTFHPESDSYPCWDNFYISHLGVQAPGSGLLPDTGTSTWDKDNTRSFFTVGMSNFGKPTEMEFEPSKTGYVQAVFPSGAGQTPYATQLVDTIRSAPEGIQFLQAPALWRQNCYTLQTRWYQFRTAISVSSLLYSLFAHLSSSVTIEDDLFVLLHGKCIAGPRLSDIARNIGTEDNPEWVFTFADVYGYFDKPWELVKKILKKFNIRVVVSESGGQFSFNLCSTKDYYRSSVVNLASYLDYSKYDLKPYAYTSKKIVFEDEPVGSKFQELYKNITGVDFSRYVLTSSYPVESEKSWFKDKMKYAVSSTTNVTSKYIDGETTYDSEQRKSFNLYYHMIEAFDTDDNEIDITGAPCIITWGGEAYRAGQCIVTRDLKTTNGNLFKGYYGLHVDKKMSFKLCTDTTAVMSSESRRWASEGGWGYTFGYFPVIVTDDVGGDKFLYGKPSQYNSKYPRYGSLVSDRFQDVLDAADSSTCTINVFLDKLRSASSLTVDQLIRSIYWFDNAYWCVYNIKSYIAGSNEPTEVVFLKINDLRNYITPSTIDITVQASHCTLTATIASTGVSTTVTSSHTFTLDRGDALYVSLASTSSGYVWRRWALTPYGGETQYDYRNSLARIYASSSADGTVIVGEASASHIVTASVTGSGTVTPGSQSVLSGESCTIFATPSDGYVVTSWSDTVGGVTTTYTTRAEEFTIENIQGNHTVVCNFGMATAVCSVRMIDIGGTDRGTITVTDMDTLEPIADPSVFTCPLDTNLSINLSYDNTLYSFIGWYEDSSRTTPASDLLPITPTIFNTVASSLSFNRYAVLQRTGSRTHAINTTANPAAGYYWSSHTIDIEEEGSVQLTYNARASYTFTSLEVYNSLNQWVTLTTTYTDPDGTVFTRSSNHVNVSNVMGDHTVRINSTYVPPSTYKCTVNCAVPGATVTYRINSGSNQTITSFPYEITGLYEDNSVYLTYSHSPYSDFVNWTGYQPSSNPTVSFAMPAQDVTMTANASSYTVSLADSPSGSVSEFSIEGTYVSKTATSVTAYAGSTVSLSYTPADGYSADGWTDISGSSPSRTYTVTSDATLTARCQSGARPKVTVSLPSALYQAGASLSYAINGGSVVDFGQGGILPVDSGDRVDLYITHNDGNGNSYVTTEQFTWGSEGSAGSSHIFKTNITSDWTIGVCSANQYTIDASVDPDLTDPSNPVYHGTASVTYTNGGQVISSADLIYAGAYVTVHVVPDSGWSLDRWSSDNSPEPNHSIRKAATAEHWVALLCQKIYIYEPIANPTSGVSSFSVVLNGSTPITSFPHEVTAGNSVVITANLNLNYDVTGWTYTGGSGTTSNNVLTISSITENVNATITLQQFAYVTAVMADGVPGSITNVEYSTDSGSTWTSLSSWSVGSEGHVPVDSQIRITSSSTWTNNPYCETDDASSEVATGNPATFTQLLYNSGAIEFTFYWSQSTVYKTINVTGEEGAVASGVTFTYQVAGESELPLPSGGVSLAVGTNVTLRYYHETSTAGTYYDDAYQWKSGGSVVASNVNYFTINSVTTDLNLTVSSKQFTVSFSEYPTLSGAVNFHVNSSSQNVYSYTAFAGTSYSVLALSGNQVFTAWRDGASNPRTEVVPDNNSTTLEALYEQGYSVGPIEDSLYQGQAIFENLTLTITPPGGSPEEYEPSASHPNIRVGSTVEVSYTLDNHYTANNWSIGQTTYPASTTSFTVSGQMSPMTLNVTEWLHVFGSYTPEGGGSLASFSYSTDSGQSWTDVGIPSSSTPVAVPNNSLVKFDCNSSSGYIFSEWRLDGTTLAGSSLIQNYTWDSMSVPASSLNPMITAIFSGGTTWDGLTFSPVGVSSTIYLEYYQNTEGTVPIPDCEYSTDGTTWTSMPKYQAGTPVGTPLTFTSDIYVRGLNTGGWYQGSSNSYGHKFIISGNTYASGNIMSLIGQTGTAITTIPNARCFCRTFYGCSALASMPTLNATNVTQYCYYRMFQGCIGLTSTSVLPAINPQSASNSCSNLFYNCSNLAEVNATQMLHTTSTVTYTKDWLYGVAATGTFNAKRLQVWPTESTSAIPPGWTRYDY